MRKTEREMDIEAKGEAERHIQTDTDRYRHTKKLRGIVTQYSEKERYRDRQTDRQIDGLTNSLTVRRTDRRTDRQIDR